MSILIPKDYNIKEVCTSIRKAMNASELNHGMGARADMEKISLFEEAFGVKLPQAYKDFLSEFDGGFIADEEANWYWMNGEYNTCKQMCSHFLSIEEIFDEYESWSLDDHKLRDGFEGFYPYIPFYETAHNEKLVFVNAHDGESSHFVYAAFHDEPASAWFVVAKNFTDFLIDYINTDGKPNLYTLEMDYYAENNLSLLGNQLAKINDPKGRIKRASAYISLFPDDSTTYTKRANAYRDDGQYKAALVDFKKSLELDPEYALTYYCRGSMLLSLKKARQALIDFDSACQLEPEDPLLLTGRADAFYQLNKLDEALADCNKALEIEGRYYIAYSIRHSVYTAMGETEKAELDDSMLDELLAEDE